jgi:hypothetical protein
MLIKIAMLFCLSSLLSLVALLAFPVSDFHFGYLAGVLASSAFLLALISSYRAQKYVRTRGGIIYKDENPIKYFVAHISLGFFGVALLFFTALGTFGFMH